MGRSYGLSGVAAKRVRRGRARRQRATLLLIVRRKQDATNGKAYAEAGHYHYHVVREREKVTLWLMDQSGLNSLKWSERSSAIGQNCGRINS
eukprot:scaffold32674_cov29-Tisochrysis_lutea.AAC.7